VRKDVHEDVSEVAIDFISRRDLVVDSLYYDRYYKEFSDYLLFKESVFSGDNIDENHGHTAYNNSQFTRYLSPLPLRRILMSPVFVRKQFSGRDYERNKMSLLLDNNTDNNNNNNNNNNHSSDNSIGDSDKCKKQADNLAAMLEEYIDRYVSWLSSSHVSHISHINETQSANTTVNTTTDSAPGNAIGNHHVTGDISNYPHAELTKSAASSVSATSAISSSRSLHRDQK
jgi:hypothetical protein